MPAGKVQWFILVVNFIKYSLKIFVTDEHGIYKKTFCQTKLQILLKSDSHFTKGPFYLIQRKPFKIDEKYFLFQLKSYSRSYDISIFGYVGKRLDQKVKVFSKFMTPQTGKQIILIHILLKISRSKGTYIMKLGQLIEYNMSNNSL